MITSAYKTRSEQQRKSGVALVVVLAFVVLLTGVVIAFFSRAMADRQLSNSSSNQAKADELARSALNIVTGDLKQEIVNGSTTLPNPNPNSYPPIYSPTTNAYMVPVRNGVPLTWSSTGAAGNAANSTFLRISSPTLSGNSVAVAPTSGPFVDHAASAALSTGLSSNGRSISLARWNQHYLLPLKSAASPADTTPDPNFVAPSWVYVTASGGPTNPPLTVPSTGVLGRYAYAIYDEGALLDANVAGFPADTGTSSPSVPQPYNLKGALSFADLTMLNPGNLTQTSINSLVGWRNYASMQNATTPAQPTGAFPTFTFANTTTMPTAYKNLALSNINGFVSVGTTTANSQTDQAFLGRQQLIDLVQAIDKTNFPTALLYLGTFSRAVTAPSWSPVKPVGSTIDYAAQAETSGSANRDLANVRFTTAATITHYNDGTIVNGTATVPPTASTYNVRPGDPLASSRFSLAKIAWLSTVSPQPSDNKTTIPAAYVTPIQACFGLKWGTVGAANGGNPCWSYVGGATPTSVAFAGTIETLDQVAKEGREPNFFELLKAAILSGSVGVSPGKAAFQNGATPTSERGSEYKPPATNANAGCDNLYSQYITPISGVVPAPAGISDMQIMQIGANIIDEYDADSYPTAIYFKYKGMTAPCDAAAGNGIFGSIDMVYGEENLPDLLGFYQITGTLDGLPTSGSTPGTTHSLTDWWQPEIWNMHQMPNPATATMSPPANFQIRGYGQLKFSWYTYGAVGSPSSGSSSPQTLDNVQTITFADSNPTQSALYASPYLLTQNTVPGITAIANGPQASQMVANPQMKDYSQNPFVGFWAGTDTAYTGIPLNASGQGTQANIDPETAGCVTFCLGWLDSAGGFHPYSFETGMFIYTFGALDVSNSDRPNGGALPNDTSGTGHILNDPRTTSFAGCDNWELATAFTLNSNSAGRKMANYGAGVPVASNFVYSTTSSTGLYIEDWAVNQPTPLASTKATATYYSDSDGVVRPGDGWMGNATTGDGMLLYSGTGTTSGVAGTGGTAQGDTRTATTVSGSGSNTTGNTYHGRRPVILNRPFRSVGELGYAFRSLPFKSLDFASTSSADAGLLDVFSISDQTRVADHQLNNVVTGQVNLSNAPYPVIEALLSGASRKDFDPSYNYPAPQTLAQGLATQLNTTTGNGPLLNRSDLVLRLGANPSTGAGPIRTALANISTTDQGNKTYLEAPVRALADVTNTRTWNLLIDVIAQAGTFSPNAPATAAALNSSFIVQGERRYWLHVAIDRFTGKVVDEYFEPVYE